MTTRIFGARKGAGTQVRETSAAKPILEGPLGSTIMVGIFKSGPIGEVVPVTGGLGHYLRVFGGLTQDSEAPLCAEHFYEAGGGAGQLYGLRVTDGSEVKASRLIYDRDVELAVAERNPAAKLAANVLDLAAENGGRWGGRRRVQTGNVTLSTAITGTNVVDLGFTCLVDEWEGATLSFPDDDSGNEFTVDAITTAGIATITGDFTDDVINGTDGDFLLSMANTHELTAKPEYLAVEIGDSAEVSTGFSLYVHRDGSQVKLWEDVDLDSAGDRYWYDAIDSDGDNYELDPTDNFSGDPTAYYKRPANFAEIPAPGGVSTNVVTFQVVRWATDDSATSSGFDPYIDTVNDLSWGSAPKAATIVLTFTSGTAYNVAATYTDGGYAAGQLPAGVLGTAYPSPNAFLPGWNVVAGGTPPQAGDVVTIYARCLPEDLADKGAYLYPAAGPSDGDTRVAYKVVSNTHESVTLAPSQDVSSEIDAPGAPGYAGAASQPHDMSTTSDTYIYTVGGSGPFTLTSSLSGASETGSALAADLNARELARASAVAADKLVEFSADPTTGAISVVALQDFGEVDLVTGAGTCNAICGFTAGTVQGTTPTRSRLQWRQELAGGYDGIADIDADDYSDAWAIGSSPLNELEAENTGVIRLAMPGVTDADAQASMMLWAYEFNHVCWLEIPDTVVTEAAAVAWHEANLAIGPSQDYAPCNWPSYAKIRSPYGSGLYTAPTTGLFLGLSARWAVDNKGYQDAPAGLAFTLSPYVKDYPDGVATRLSSEIVNGYGLNLLKRAGPKFYMWGGRIAGDGARGWLHKRLTMSHIGRTLLTNSDSLAFKRINAATFATVKKLLIGLFAPWYRSGWFSDVDGPDFTDQVLIKVDAANNPATERALGNLHAGISFGVVDTSERVIFTVGPKGLETS